jgi:hypothetical protein
MQPVMAALVLGFCVVAIGGLLLTLPRGGLLTSRAGRSATGVSTQTPAAPASSRAPGPPSAGVPPPTRGPTSDEAAQPGPWVEGAATPTSGRGLTLGYRYRTLPPGGESRYEWVVQVHGGRSVLDGVEVVNWQMDPPAKNGADFVSRDRAADGFPLFGHGPGGWFGVSARIRYRDGAEETLARRIDLSDD